MSGFTTHDVLKYIDFEWTSSKGKISVPCDKEGGSISISEGGTDTSEAITDIQGRMGLPRGKSVPAQVTIKVLDTPQSYKVFKEYMKDQIGSVYLPAVLLEKESDGVVFELNMRNVRIQNPGSIKFTFDLSSKVEMTLFCSQSDMKIITSYSI